MKTKVPDNVQEISLKLEPRQIRIQASVRLILPMTATALCTLRIEANKRVFVELQSVEILGAGVKGIVQKQLDAINPVLDVTPLPVDVSLDEIRIEEGRLVALGKLMPPGAS